MKLVFMPTGPDHYADLLRSHPLGLNFCLTFVRGMSAAEVVSRLGGPEPVDIVGVRRLQLPLRMVTEFPDELGVDRPTGPAFVAVAEVGDWTMVVEPEGFLCADHAVAKMLARSGELVSFYFNDNVRPRLVRARNGGILVEFDPCDPAVRSGSEVDLAVVAPELVLLCTSLAGATTARSTRGPATGS